MRRHILIALTASTLPLAMAVCAPALAAPPAISVATLKDVTQTLSSDAYEGRAPTTPAEDKTVATIVERFKRAGLKPGNPNATGAAAWVQDVPLVEITTDPKAVLRVTGGKTPLDLAYKTDMVVKTYQVQPRTEIRDADIVFVGYGINAPERGWNDYAGQDVRGKVVVILINDPDYQTKTLDGPFGGRAMTYYGRWTYKYEEAARQGAAAALIVHDTEPAAYGFNVVVTSNTGPQLELDDTGGHMDQSRAIGWLTNDAARRLLASAGQNLDTLSAAAKVKGFRPVALNLKASLTLDNAIRRQASKNVVGILPGKARPQDVVLHSAHWDHLGRCEAVNGDDICNGAADNASGVAGLVAVAEAQAKAGPAARTMLFMAVTGEESGLLGSAYYAAHPLYPLGRTVAALNMDVLNLYGPSRDVVVVGPGKSELEQLLARDVARQGRVIGLDPSPEKGHYYRSDHFSFALKGVPAVSFGSGIDLVEGGTAAGQKAEDDYVANRYHQPSDEYDPNWNWQGAVQDLGLIYGMGRELAEGSNWPAWYPTAEFRAAREASRKGL